MSKKKNISADRIVGFSAIFISMLSLFIFSKQTAIIQQQGELSALPYLVVETGYDPDEYLITYTLNNYGIGPAIIEEMVFKYNDERHRTDLFHFVQNDFFKKDSLTIVSGATFDAGLAIPAGEERIMLSVGGSQKAYDRGKKFFERLIEKEELDYEIKYSSIYNKIWSISRNGTKPVSIK
ncbi:MAG: hypothetical protein AAGB24_12100 [Bacteroidota bacterium]